MCSISENRACYSYVRTKFNFSRDHNVLSPSVVLPVALLKTDLVCFIPYKPKTFYLSKAVMSSCSFYSANKTK